MIIIFILLYKNHKGNLNNSPKWKILLPNLKLKQKNNGNLNNSDEQSHLQMIIGFTAYLQCLHKPTCSNWENHDFLVISQLMFN